MNQTQLLDTTADIDDAAEGQLGPVQPAGLSAQQTVMMWVKNTGDNDVTLTPWGWGPDATPDESTLAAGVEWGVSQSKTIAAGAIDVWTYENGVIPDCVGFKTACSGGTSVRVWINGRA